MIGIFIFVVGLLALSSLQGALTRSMADAKVRTTAANIAERHIEEAQRVSVELLSDTAVPPTFFAYNDIVSSDTTETVNGIIYSIGMDVTDYYYDLAGDTFTTTAPTGATAPPTSRSKSPFPGVPPRTFRGVEGTDITAADLGSGEIVLTATIPALVTSASARVADESNGSTAAPPVSYHAGSEPRYHFAVAG